MVRREKRSPKHLVTYVCTKCRWELTRTELDKPKCTLCGKAECLEEIKREDLTPESLEAAMMKSVDTLMKNLEQAYASKEGEWKNDEEEVLLLEAMAKAKNLEKHVQKTFGPRGKKPHIHAISITI